MRVVGFVGKRRYQDSAVRWRQSTKAGLVSVFVCLVILFTFYVTVDLQLKTDKPLPSLNPLSLHKAIRGGRNPKLSLWTIKTMMNTDFMNQENNVFKSANLLAAGVSDNILKLRSAVTVREDAVQVMHDLKIFYRESRPPEGHFIKGEIFMLHGQAFTSANWLEKQTIQTFAAAGYRVVAVDLPGYGNTGGRTLSAEEKPALLTALIQALNLDRPVLVSPSMSGSYSLPFAMHHADQIRAFIPIAPVGAADFTEHDYQRNKLPTLIVYGDRDTSLGILSASHLRALYNGRVVKIPNAGHACYLNNPDVFHTVCLNFLDLVRTYSP